MYNLFSGNPQSLLNTVWMNNGIFFNFRGRQDHVNLLNGDLELKKDSKGTEYVEFTGNNYSRNNCLERKKQFHWIKVSCICLRQHRGPI